MQAFKPHKGLFIVDTLLTRYISLAWESLRISFRRAFPTKPLSFLDPQVAEQLRL